jgi:uncharacterized protein
MGTDVQTMKGAWEIWDDVASDERISFLPESDDIEIKFRTYSRLTSISPKVWADAYLLAFAQTAGLALVTFDHALGNRAKDSVILS